MLILLLIILALLLTLFYIYILFTYFVFVFYLYKIFTLFCYNIFVLFLLLMFNMVLFYIFCFCFIYLFCFYINIILFYNGWFYIDHPCDLQTQNPLTDSPGWPYFCSWPYTLKSPKSITAESLKSFLSLFTVILLVLCGMFLPSKLSFPLPLASCLIHLHLLWRSRATALLGATFDAGRRQLGGNRHMVPPHPLPSAWLFPVNTPK